MLEELERTAEAGEGDEGGSDDDSGDEGGGGASGGHDGGEDAGERHARLRMAKASEWDVLVKGPYEQRLAEERPRLDSLRQYASRAHVLYLAEYGLRCARGALCTGACPIANVVGEQDRDGLKCTRDLWCCSLAPPEPPSAAGAPVDGARTSVSTGLPATAEAAVSPPGASQAIGGLRQFRFDEEHQGVAAVVRSQYAAAHRSVEQLEKCLRCGPPRPS